MKLSSDESLRGEPAMNFSEARAGDEFLGSLVSGEDMLNG